MQEKFGNLGFNTVFNPRGDSDCFYSGAGRLPAWYKQEESQRRGLWIFEKSSV